VCFHWSDISGSFSAAHQLPGIIETKEVPKLLGRNIDNISLPATILKLLSAGSMHPGGRAGRRWSGELTMVTASRASSGTSQVRPRVMRGFFRFMPAMAL
jgi:hypothetical protein